MNMRNHSDHVGEWNNGDDGAAVYVITSVVAENWRGLFATCSCFDLCGNARCVNIFCTFMCAARQFLVWNPVDMFVA